MVKHLFLSASVAIVAIPLYCGLAQAKTSTVAGLKTAGACNDEYKANKGALKDAKEKKKDFIAACRALPPGTPTPIGTAAVAPAPAAPPPASVPAPQAPSASTSRREAPAPGPSAAPAPSARTSASPGESACGNAYAHLPANHTAVQFCDEGQAKARCVGQPVVWVNTKSKIYHHAGANTYGHTKEGAYMCEGDAKAEGDRVSANGH